MCKNLSLHRGRVGYYGRGIESVSFPSRKPLIQKTKKIVLQGGKCAQNCTGSGRCLSIGLIWQEKGSE